MFTGVRQTNDVQYNYALYSPPSLSDTVASSVDRAQAYVSISPSYSDTVGTGVDRAPRVSMSPSKPDTVGVGVDRALCVPMPPSKSDTVSLGVDRAHVADAGASLPTGDNGVGGGYIDGGLWNQQESTNRDNTRGRSVTKRRLGPTRHSAPNDFPLTEFANRVSVKIMGIDVPPTKEHLDDVKTSLRRYKRDGNDDTLRDVNPYFATRPTSPTHRVCDDAARRIGLYPSGPPHCHMLANRGMIASPRLRRDTASATLTASADIEFLVVLSPSCQRAALAQRRVYIINGVTE